ncbi:helix-turn-helix domain-containing protein [Mesorhizobium sp. Cs1299R1N3]|uniref:helix-turn-helix domain-containing protein n=1 Tax=Mesorhizobium sp. Cs1299R1N3 TaxID=3015173 RepID=UPI00301D7630
MIEGATKKKTGGKVDKLENDEILRRLAIFREAGSKRKAADIIGITRATLQKTLRRASERGLDGLLAGQTVPEGYIVQSHSITRDADGYIERTSIKTRADKGGEFVKPADHLLKGMSVLTDGEDRILLKWHKTDRDLKDTIDKAEIIRQAFEDFVPSAPFIIRPQRTLADRLTVYIFCDWHVGLFAYGKETGGPDWDLSIAKRVLLQSIADLIEQTPKSKRAVILGLGDLLHADNSRNMTERSGNILDVDTRYAKTLSATSDLLVEGSEMVAAKHDEIELVLKPGNHDPNSTVGLVQAMRMYWRNTERVEVDDSPNPFYWKRFGVNLIGGTHGDNAKIPDMPLIMANMRKQDWADTFTRHFHTGHIHHDTVKEIGGVHVWSHRAPVAQDAYHAANGYLSGRSMRACNYDYERGTTGTSEVEIR